MLTEINPKLPMRNKQQTLEFYVGLMGFQVYGSAAYEDYLMLFRDKVQLHFFKFSELDPLSNYGQVYIRTSEIRDLYQSFQEGGVPIHPNGHLQRKPWGMIEFSVLDPDHNLLTFGEEA